MSYDPRGLIRKAVAIQETPSVTLVTLDCGHIGQFNQIFHYTIGNPHHCFKCGQEAELKTINDPR